MGKEEEFRKSEERERVKSTWVRVEGMKTNKVWQEEWLENM